MFRLLRGLIAPVSLMLCSLTAMAQSLVQVDQAWARASLPGQNNSGVYMRLTAREPLRLVAASSPAGQAELHEMKLDGDVMRMRELPALELPAGKTVELRPGGLHVMLTGLKAPLRPDSTLSLTLLLRDAKGSERRVEVQVPVRTQAPGPAGGARVADHGSMHEPASSHQHQHAPSR